MKIVHLINYFQPKLGYQETFLAKEQIRLGHDVSVITSDKYRPFPDFKKTHSVLLGKRYVGCGFRIEDGIPVYRLKSILELKFRIWVLGLERIITRLQPDLIIAHGLLSYSFQLAKLRSKGAKFKLIIDEHIIAQKIRADFLGRIFYTLRKENIKTRLLPWVDKFVGVTEESCMFLTGLQGIPNESVVHIPLGSDGILFRFDGVTRESVRRKLGIAPDQILLLYTGKISEDKGLKVLFRAFNSLNTRQKVFLAVVGGGTDEFKKELTGLLCAEKRKDVIFQDMVSNLELPGFYSASDICIWPETVSISILDAFACSRAVIASDIAPVKERFTNENGLLYRAGDHNDLAEKIVYLAENDFFRSVLGSNARDLVDKQFSWEIINERFMKSAGF